MSNDIADNHKLRHVVLGDSDARVRLELGSTLTRLAEQVDRFTDGDDALQFVLKHQPEMTILSLSCWQNVDVAIGALKKARKSIRHCLIVTHRDIMPVHLGRLRKVGISHILGHPVDPLYIFRLVHRRYGVIARRFDRVNVERDVFWGASEDKEVIGHTTDISRGGFLLVTDKQLSLGASLFLGVQLEENTAIENRVEIVKRDDEIFRPATGYGVSFIDLRAGIANVLDEAIDSFQQNGAREAPVTFVQTTADKNEVPQ